MDFSFKMDYNNLRYKVFLNRERRWILLTLYQQNIKLIKDDSGSLPVTVPYDFDHSGIVGAPNAEQAPELEMSSTLERRYRGYCIDNQGGEHRNQGIG